MNKSEKIPDEGSRLNGPVFISYAIADRKQALSVCTAIERRGIDCWIASRDVQPGENYQEAIVRAIRKSRALVLVFSESANNSDEIKKELSLVSRFRIPLIALRIEDVEPSDAFAYELSTRQWIDAFDGWDKSLDSLVQSLGSLAPGATAEPASRARSKTRTGGSGFPLHRIVAIAASAALLLIAAIAAWLLLRPASSAAHSMQVRLTAFDRLSNDVPASIPPALADEFDAAFNDDGVVTVSRAAAPPPGNSPAYAIGGTIRREGDKIKVIIRLTNERSGTTLWSNDFSYDAAQVARIPHLAAVDGSMVIRCGLFGASTYARSLPDSALIPYLGYCVDQDGASKSLNFARKTVAIVPDFSWGWSAVAIAATGSWLRAGPNDDSFHTEALKAADRAIELDPSNSEAYTYKSFLVDRNDLAGQEALLRKALAARPLACGCEHHIYAAFLLQVGRIKDSLAEFRRAIDVLPLNAGTQISYGDALLTAGNIDGAKAAFDAAADLSSDATARQKMSVQTAPFDGDYAGASRIVSDPKIPAPQTFRDAVGGGFEALASGSPDSKAKAIARLNALPLGNADLEINLLALLGAPDVALRKIAQDAKTNFGFSRSALWLPSMAGTLRDPSFPAVARQLGLMTYWKTTHSRPDVCSAKAPPPFCRTI